LQVDVFGDEALPASLYAENSFVSKPPAAFQCNAEENYSWKGPEKEWPHPGKQRFYPQELRLTIKVSFYNRFEIKRSTPLPPNHEYDVPSNFGFLSVLVFPKGDQ